jgi:hypothetical protein
VSPPRPTSPLFPVLLLFLLAIAALLTRRGYPVPVTGFYGEVLRTSAAIRRATGAPVRCLRPPYGAVDAASARRVGALGLRVVPRLTPGGRAARRNAPTGPTVTGCGGIVLAGAVGAA